MRSTDVALHGRIFSGKQRRCLAQDDGSRQNAADPGLQELPLRLPGAQQQDHRHCQHQRTVYPLPQAPPRIEQICLRRHQGRQGIEPQQQPLFIRSQQPQSGSQPHAGEEIIAHQALNRPFPALQKSLEREGRLWLCIHQGLHGLCIENLRVCKIPALVKGQVLLRNAQGRIHSLVFPIVRETIVHQLCAQSIETLIRRPLGI